MHIYICTVVYVQIDTFYKVSIHIGLGRYQRTKESFRVLDICICTYMQFFINKIEIIISRSNALTGAQFRQTFLKPIQSS